MATRYWVGGSGSQSWSNTANWSATAGGAGGASVPTTGDTAYVNSGTSNIDSGLAQTSVSNLSLTVGFSGTIGTASSSLQFGAGCTLYATGSPTVYIGAPAASINVIGFENSSPTIIVTDGAAVLYGGGGTLTLAAAVTAWLIWNLGANILMEASNTASTAAGSIFNYGGQTICRRPMSNATDELEVYGGSFVYSNNATMDNLQVFSGGVYYHSTTATITFLAVGAGGVCSASGATGPFTVTNAQFGAGGSLFADTLVPITYTSVTKIGTNRSA